MTLKLKKSVTELHDFPIMQSFCQWIVPHNIILYGIIIPEGDIIPYGDYISFGHTYSPSGNLLSVQRRDVYIGRAISKNLPSIELFPTQTVMTIVFSEFA